MKILNDKRIVVLNVLVFADQPKRFCTRRTATVWFMIHSGSLWHWRSQSHMFTFIPRCTVSSYVTVCHAPRTERKQDDLAKSSVEHVQGEGPDVLFLFSALWLSHLSISVNKFSSYSEKTLVMKTSQSFSWENNEKNPWNCCLIPWSISSSGWLNAYIYSFLFF